MYERGRTHPTAEYLWLIGPAGAGPKLGISFQPERSQLVRMSVGGSQLPTAELDKNQVAELIRMLQVTHARMSEPAGPAWGALRD